MDKLIKLLNEYEEDKIKNSEWLDVMNIWKCEWTLHYYNNYKDENVFDNVRYLIISKEYGFIERLLEKKKIDRDELYHEMNWVVYYNHYEWEIIEEYSDSDWLIMLLSVQNEPIKFLLNNIKTDGKRTSNENS